MSTTEYVFFCKETSETYIILSNDRKSALITAKKHFIERFVNTQYLFCGWYPDATGTIMTAKVGTNPLD